MSISSNDRVGKIIITLNHTKEKILYRRYGPCVRARDRSDEISRLNVSARSDEGKGIN
jgi:hypothetical protein